MRPLKGGPALRPADAPAPRLAEAAVRLVPLEEMPSLGERVVRAVVVTLVLAGAGVVAWKLSFLTTPLALAILGFYVLSPLVNLIENRGASRGLAVLIVFGGGLLVLIGIGFALWPSLENWLQQKPSQAGEKSMFEIQLGKRLDSWERAALAGKYRQIDWHALFNQVRQLLENQRKGLTETLPQVAMGMLSSAGTLVLAPIMTLFLLIDGSAMHKAIVAQVPNRHFETVLTLLHRVDRQIAAYLRGAASESAIVAALLAVVLWALGMPSALLFACIYGVANVIPLLGPVMGAGAGLLYALMDPGAPSLGVLAVGYLGVYVLDAMLINPMVVGKNLNLHPLTIIVGISIGGSLAGILGMLVSIPFIAIGKAIAYTIWDAVRRQQAHRRGYV
ncbi:MAG TPA: AI-2E family transporter [Myxococcales bacterium]|nr:AI-2E family transporter [Myxococcales bacterium]